MRRACLASSLAGEAASSFPRPQKTGIEIRGNPVLVPLFALIEVFYSALSRGCLFFACPKKSHQKKRHPAYAPSLRDDTLRFSP
jgi:hypothetical protein